MQLTITFRKNENQHWVFDHEFENSVNVSVIRGTNTALDYYYEKLYSSQGNTVTAILNTRRCKNITTQFQLSSEEKYKNGYFYDDLQAGLSLWFCESWFGQYFEEIPQILYVRFVL